MTDFLPRWTVERITALAPSTSIAQSGQQLAHPSDAAWQAVASDNYSAWAVYQGSAKNPYQIRIDLLKVRSGDKAWHCNCPSYQSPCKHIMAVLYMLLQSADEITSASPPHWVQDWLDKAAVSARKRESHKQRERVITPEKIEQRQKQLDKRKHKIQAGLQELEQWMENLIRRGLTDPQIRDTDFWDNRAARLVDAQAPSIATWLRQMGSIPQQGGDWIPLLLDELGRLYLVLQSFKRFEALDVETQADLRSVVGWHLKKDEMVYFDALTIQDTWQVMGRFIGDVAKNPQNRRQRGLKTQRIWLFGKETQRHALILEFAFGDSPFDTLLTAGTVIEADLIFYPSRYPLRAFIHEIFDERQFEDMVSGKNILDNVAEYSQAIAKNPWLLQFPFLLDAVIPVKYDNQWIVREIDGTYLPISSDFSHVESLFSLSGGHPIQVAGEWDSNTLYPTGAIVQNRFVDFEMIGEL